MTENSIIAGNINRVSNYIRALSHVSKTGHYIAILFIKERGSYMKRRELGVIMKTCVAALSAAVVLTAMPT
mgnify:FL=1